MILGIKEPNTNWSLLRNPLYSTTAAKLKGARYHRCSCVGRGDGDSPGTSGGLRGNAGLLSTERRAAGGFGIGAALEALPCRGPAPGGAVESAAKSRTPAGPGNAAGLPVPRQTRSTALPGDPDSSLSHPRLLQAVTRDLLPRCLGWHSSTGAVIFQ